MGFNSGFKGLMSYSLIVQPRARVEDSNLKDAGYSNVLPGLA